MSGILNAYSGGTYSGLPGAPTIGTATATGSTTASVAFTAPTNTGGLSITGYQVLSSPGSITATGASSPITVTGLTGATTYTFQVRAQNAIGYGSYSGSSNSITTSLAPSSQSYTTAGSYSWVAPAGVTKVSVVAVGGGNGGSGNRYGTCSNGGNGAGLGYKNNITVIPGNSYTLVVGAGGSGGLAGSSSGGLGGDSYFCRVSLVAGKAGTICVPGTYVGDGGGNGGKGICYVGGGGAGGYSGAGGHSYTAYPAAQAGAGGGGGGGNSWIQRIACCNCATSGGSGGGGVGLFGQGSNGAAGYGSDVSSGTATGGGGGSSGLSGGNATICNKGSAYGIGTGGSYGGGGGGGGGKEGTGAYSNKGSFGANGAVRIVWPGCARTFPSTCVGSP